ncbi:hypothetical protein MIR68_005934 [Amoeboaphelidium protococcarum]|nr:hypothetical protein MIR68_005934 [Amoeboaphelidium protococcarum]
MSSSYTDKAGLITNAGSMPQSQTVVDIGGSGGGSPVQGKMTSSGQSQSMPGGGMEQQQQQDENALRQIFKASSHPRMLFFHLLFRSVAILFYVLASFIFIDSFILAFITITILLSFDFWTVKNLSGRFLVGLRWWNDSEVSSAVESTGSQQAPGLQQNDKGRWVFESRPPNHPQNKTDARVFWWSLYITQVAWIVFLIVSIIKLNFTWLLLVMLALSLNTANLVGYSRCEKDRKQRYKNNSFFSVNTGLLGDMMTGGGGGGQFGMMAKMFGR